MTKIAEGTLFEIHVRGDTTGKIWDGKFRAKSGLSFRDKLQADKIRRELLGADADAATSDSKVFAAVLSQLGVRIVESPEWWAAAGNGVELEDWNVLEAIYTAAVKIETDRIAALEAEGERVQAALKSEVK